MQELLDPPKTQTAGGIINCPCRCHKTIEQGGGRPGNCVHCRVIGTGGALEPSRDDD